MITTIRRLLNLTAGLNVEHPLLRGRPPRRMIFILSILLFAFHLSLFTAYAQERGRILSTTEQQYQNLIRNGSFEAFSAGSSVAPDGFAAEGVATGTGTVARDSTTKFQTYGVKLTQTNTAGTYILRYDTAITGFGASLTGTSADLATTEWQRLTLYSNNGYAASAWVKLPGGSPNPAAVTIKSDATEKVYVEIQANAINDYCYIDGLQVTEGPIAPAFVNAGIVDTGDQKIFGDIRIQDDDTTNYILLDKDTGNITASGTISATADNANTLDNLDSLQFLRSDLSDSYTSGTLSMATGTTLNVDTGAALSIDGTWDIGGTAIAPTAAELNFVDGVTSLIQTQLNAKAPTASPTFTGTVTMPGTGVWTSAGNIGIGTLAPTELFHIYKVQNSGARMKLQNTQAGTGSFASFDVVSDAATLQLQSLSSLYTY